MIKKKQKSKWVIILLVVLVGIPSVVYAKVQHDHSDTWLYAMEWEDVLPDTLKRVYDVKTPAAFRCDGSHIAVFEIENQTKELDRFIKTFHNGKDDRITSSVKDALASLEVEAPYQIDLEKAYIWRFYSKNNGFDRLSILYFT